jgi:dTDP-4-dehydrorhamnose reductase
MKVIVTGANGQLGSCLKDIEPTWVYLDRSELDLSSRESISTALKKYNPKVIVNCAAYTNVELAEDESEKAHLVNGHNLMELTKTKAHLVHISTDYVFDGSLKRPYFSLDVPCPINEYGKSKLLGERIIQSHSKSYSIIRTSWVYSEYQNNFFKTIFGLAKRLPKLTVVNDQFGAPTYARDLAKYIANKTNTLSWGKSDLLHFTGSPYCTWYDFAKEIGKYSNKKCQFSPVSSSEYPTNAQRPVNSRLYTNELMRPWKESLKECVTRYKSSLKK